MITLSEAMQQIKLSDKPFYIYVLHKPNGTPFYVGKGKVKTNDQRIAYHEQEARSNGKWKKHPHFNHHKLNTIKQIWRQGKQIFYSVDSWHDTDESVNLRERELIDSLGRKITGEGPLTNITLGGEKEMSSIPEETRKQISESLKEYYEENPARKQQLKEQILNWAKDNPEEVKRACSEGGKAAIPALIDWMHNNRAGLDERNKQHSEFMKVWHENNRDKTKEVAKKRNEKFRTPEHRAHMAIKTKEYAAKKLCIKNQCLEIMTTQKIDRVLPSGQANLATWEKVLNDLKGIQ